MKKNILLLLALSAISVTAQAAQQLYIRNNYGRTIGCIVNNNQIMIPSKQSTLVGSIPTMESLSINAVMSLAIFIPGALGGSAQTTIYEKPVNATSLVNKLSEQSANYPYKNAEIIVKPTKPLSINSLTSQWIE